MGQGTRGILNPAQGFEHFRLERRAPPAELEPFLERFWWVRWDLTGRPEYEQEILPYPCVNLSFDANGYEVHGPGTRRFVARLTGRGFAVGAKFRPAGFFAFARVPMRTLVDRVLSPKEALGAEPAAPTSDDEASIAGIFEVFLGALTRVASGDAAEVNELVRLAQDDRSITRAEQLARRADVSERSLHRLFERYVGVGPKWIVRRSRVQEAADRVKNGERVDWSAVAQELGYHDQAHLIRDFREQVGLTPAAYAKRCREATDGSSLAELRTTPARTA
ncbi:MAG TPA: helix-turn-helix domain-containing protein [Polyangiaceae bacterium]|jgi:AraC-like DNA-binding protein|nr:helix-turn-helix domain-containing protein [Polyangiaceae bacterium]